MFRVFIIYLLCSLSPSLLAAKNHAYDIAYIWADDLELVLDYQLELEKVLDPKYHRKLRIVGRETGEYGIVYDLNSDKLLAVKEMVRQGVFLGDAGLSECFVVEDEGYYRLFNVSYGLGPNLEDLKKLYAKIYHYLGQEVGKNLYIEKTDSDNYTLIYRRRGDRVSTYAVAKKHRKVLKRRKIYTSITPENNNPVIFGESSFLDKTTDSPDASSVAKKQQKSQIDRKKTVTSVPKPQPKTDQRYSLGIGSDNDIEKSIEKYIKALRKKGKLSSDETTGWMVLDLTSGKRVVDINADQVFQAASMIKPFIALAFFHQAKDGKFIYGPKSRAKMERMIQRSDNPATNWVMRVAGGPAKCQEILQRYYGHIFKETKIVEYIPAGGKTYKNSAIPSDYVRFLRALWNNELPYGKEIRRLMSLPGRDRLYNGTPIPQGTLVYNKTGSTAHLCGDMGILVPRDKAGRRFPYALVGIIERSSRAKNYGNWMLTRGNVIRKVSTIVYEEMKRQYRLL